MAAESAGQIAPEGECLLLILLFMPESAVAGVAHIALAAAARQRKHGEHDLQPAPMRPVQECAKQLQVPLNSFSQKRFLPIFEPNGTDDAKFTVRYIETKILILILPTIILSTINDGTTL
jgi:hypothetical protein